jgi:hypothetical protein
MNKNLIQNYFKEYLKSVNKNDEDYGTETMLMVVQNKFNYKLGLDGNATNLKDAISVKYKNLTDDKIRNDVFRRSYLYDAFKNQIKLNKLYKLLKEAMDYYKTKKNEDKNQSVEYQITHVIMAMLWVNEKKIKSKKNKNKKIIVNILIEIINKSDFSDLRTEAIYFLSLIEPSKIQDIWMIEIKEKINKEGYLQYYEKLKKIPKLSVNNAHHTALGVLAYYEYNIFHKRKLEDYETIENFTQVSSKKSKFNISIMFVLISIIFYLLYSMNN